MTIEIRRITAPEETALQMPNQPFPLLGQLLVTRDENGWQHHEQLAKKTTWQTFPEEHYQLAPIDQAGFALGAFNQNECVGLAIFEWRWNHDLYLADLKVATTWRQHGIGRQLLRAGARLGQERGVQGLTTIAQDDNLNANRFYLALGFEIGGFNDHDYRFTTQAGKGDVYYYLDLTAGLL